MNAQLLSLCDAVLACSAVGGDLRDRWSTLRQKASGKEMFADIFADIFGGRHE